VLNDDFEWQKGYGAFTVSYDRREIVSKYIRNQVEHHRKAFYGLPPAAKCGGGFAAKRIRVFGWPSRYIVTAKQTSHLFLAS
jgi:hypothetical protein